MWYLTILVYGCTVQSGSTQRNMLVIFDCDGVLVDTEDLNRQALIAVLHGYGIDLTEAQATKHFHGLSNPGVVEKAEALWGIQLRDTFIPKLEAKESELVRRYVQPIEGVRWAVTEISDRGLATCVASNGTLAAMQERLMYAGIADLFADRLFSAEQVARGKPHPDVFLYAAAAMGHSSDSCVVVEDSLPGVIAARAADMHVVAYSPPSRQSLASALEEAGGVVFSRMNSLPQLVANYLTGSSTAREL